MGRNYQTAKPTFVDDVIYKAPYELMLNALQTQDENFNKNQEKIDAFSTIGDNLEYVDKDKDARNSALNSHRDIATSLAEKINQNPALYQVYTADINRAKKDFEKDVTTGSLFEMDRAAKRRTQARLDLKNRFDKGIIREDAYEAAQNKLDRDYQGVGNGDYAESIHVYDKVDENQFQEHLNKIITPETEGVTTTKPNGAGYMITNGEVKTYITKEKVENIVTSDPKFRDWEREQLQTLERQFEDGRFDTVEEMDAEFKNRKQDFIDNSLEKLSYSKINKTDEYSQDGAFFAKDTAAREWAKFNWLQKKEEAEIDSYKVELNGDYEELDESTVNELYGSERVRVQGPIDPKTGKAPTIELSVAQKRKLLNEEKKTLATALAKKGWTLDNFKDMMMTHEGRADLVESLGIPKAKLMRQAKYNKTFAYSSVQSEKGDGKDVIENAKILRTVTNTFNTLQPSEMVSVKIIDSKGNVTQNKTISLAEAKNLGYLDGQTSAQTSNELIPKDDGYLGHDGEIVRMPAPEGTVDKAGKPVSKIVATKAYVIKNNLGKTTTSSKEVFDDKKPLLHVTPAQVSQSERVDWGDGSTKAVKKKEYNVHSSKIINDELSTVIISKELAIDPVNNK